MLIYMFNYCDFSLKLKIVNKVVFVLFIGFYENLGVILYKYVYFNVIW